MQQIYVLYRAQETVLATHGVVKILWYVNSMYSSIHYLVHLSIKSKHTVGKLAKMLACIIHTYTHTHMNYKYLDANTTRKKYIKCRNVKIIYLVFHSIC